MSEENTISKIKLNGQVYYINDSFKAEKEHLHTTADITDLATVAKSGSYNDLTNKPTIATKTSDLNNDSGFATKSYVDGQIGNINSILDTINGEVI